MLPDLSVKLYAMLPDLSVKLYAGHKSSTPPGLYMLVLLSSAAAAVTVEPFILAEM